MTGAVLRFESVTYRYPHAEQPALRDVSVDIAAGEFVVAAGLSASGKSTFLRAASGLVPHFHGGEFGGRVLTGGLDTREHGPAALSAVAGTLFQDPETQVVLSTVRAELALPLENRGHGAAAVARGVEEAALALGIGDLLDRSTHELSGGELQRVALGAALAGRPRILLLDEPTSQLDPVAGDELVWLLRRLNEEWGTAIVLVEHRLERCLGAADRVLAFDGGALACDAAPRGFLEWAAERAPALATPGARLFARAGLRPPPSGVKEARATLRAHGLLDDEAVGVAPAAGASASPSAPRPPRPARRALDCARSPRVRQAAAGARVSRRLARARGRAGGPARRRTRARAGRAGGADGPQRRRQVDAPAPRQRPARTDPRARRGGGPGGAAPAEPQRLLPRRPRQRRARPGRAGGGRPRRARRPPSARPLRRRAPAPRARDRLGRCGRGRGRGGRVRVLPAALCLDEPTRGMDRAAKGDLAATLRTAAAAGSAVLVATHDPEFAATLAERVVLLADGKVIADGPVAEVLSGGWYFSTETARIVDGALLPEDGAERLRARMTIEARP